MRAGVMLIAIEEVRNYKKLYASKTFLKMVGGRMHTSHPTYFPGSAPGHKPRNRSYDVKLRHFARHFRKQS